MLQWTVKNLGLKQDFFQDYMQYWYFSIPPKLFQNILHWLNQIFRGKNELICMHIKRLTPPPHPFAPELAK